MLVSQSRFLAPTVAFDAINLEDLNRCLISWGHKMGPLNRPMGLELAHGLMHDGRLVGVVATTALPAEKVAGMSRAEAVELARVCAARPDICRLLVRLWREFVFPALPQPWAISYQDAAQHSGNLYRFDGWVRMAFSHSGPDRRSGRVTRDKWIWGWHSDPAARDERKAP